MPWMQHPKTRNVVLVPEHMEATIERCQRDGWITLPDPTVPVELPAAAPASAAALPQAILDKLARVDLAALAALLDRLALPEAPAVLPSPAVEAQIEAVQLVETLERNDAGRAAFGEAPHNRAAIAAAKAEADEFGEPVPLSQARARGRR